NQVVRHTRTVTHGKELGAGGCRMLTGPLDILGQRRYVTNIVIDTSAAAAQKTYFLGIAQILSILNGGATIREEDDVDIIDALNGASLLLPGQQQVAGQLQAAPQVGTRLPCIIQIVGSTAVFHKISHSIIQGRVRANIGIRVLMLYYKL